MVVKSSFSGDMVVILDSSGSMQSKDVSPTRFERAQEDILKIIDGMLPNQKMAIVSMGSSGQIITEPIGDKGELRRQLKIWSQKTVVVDRRRPYQSPARLPLISKMLRL